MVISRVGSYALNRYFLSNIRSSQEQAKNFATQAATQKKVQLLEGLGFDSVPFLDMGRSVDFATGYLSTNDDLESRYKVVSRTYQDISKVMEQFREALEGIQGHETTATQSEIHQFQGKAFGFYKQLVDLLNSRYQGHYLLGGQESDVPPVSNPYKSLEEFQRIFDGTLVHFPQTSEAHQSHFEEDGEGKPWMQFIRDDGTGYSVVQDSNGLGRFSKVKVGSVIQIKGTDGNDGYYTVESASANRLAIRPMVLQDEGPLASGVQLEIHSQDGKVVRLKAKDAIFDQESGSIMISNPEILKGIQEGDILKIHGTVLNDQTFSIKGLTDDKRGLVINQRFFRDLGGSSREPLFVTPQRGFHFSSKNNLNYQKTTQSETDGFFLNPYGAPPAPLSDGTAYGTVSSEPGTFRDSFGNLLPVGTIVRLKGTPKDNNDGLYKIMGIKQDGSAIAVLPYSQASGVTSPLQTGWVARNATGGEVSSLGALTNMVVGAQTDHITLPAGVLRREDGSELEADDEIYITGSKNGNNGHFRVQRLIKNGDGTETLILKDHPQFNAETSNSMGIYLKTGKPYFESNHHVGFTSFQEDGTAVTLQSPHSNQLTLGGTPGGTFSDENSQPLVLGTTLKITQADGTEVTAHITAINAGKDTVTLDKDISHVSLAGASISFPSAPPPVHVVSRGLLFHPSQDGGNDKIAVDLDGFLRFSHGGKLPPGGFELMIRDRTTGEMRHIRIKSHEEIAGRTLLTLDDEQSIAGMKDGSFDITMFSEVQMVTMSNGDSLVMAPPGTFRQSNHPNEPLPAGTVVSYGDFRQMDGSAYTHPDDADVSGRVHGQEGNFIVDEVNKEGSQVRVRASGQPLPYMPNPNRSLLLLNQGVSGKVSAVGNYFQGDDQPHHYILDNENTAEVKDNAGEAPFEKMMRAFGLLMQGGMVQHKERLDQGLWLIKSALESTQPTDPAPFERESTKNLAEKIQQLAFDQRRLNLVNSRLSEQKKFFTLALSDMLSVDKKEAMAKFDNAMNSMRASYQVMVKIAKMNLMDYL